ncbi:MAG: hypothetical protein DMF62_14570 [Acidobacteria bacterium]|nr:MAG: hypothetical protein DMF62_14570 [Acidobacteriota bacterium]
MGVHAKLAALSGTWQGTNRLNASWMPDPIKESLSTASVRTMLNDTCLEIEYDWEFDGKHEEGLILLTCDKKGGAAHAFWSDSWHSANQLMSCVGTVSESGEVNLKGTYKVEGNPDWGWRTKILPGDGSFRYLMFNVSPEGLEEWAVEMDFTRT